MFYTGSLTERIQRSKKTEDFTSTYHIYFQKAQKDTYTHAYIYGDASKCNMQLEDGEAFK